MNVGNAIIGFTVIFVVAAAAGVVVPVWKERGKKRPFEELLDQSLAVNEIGGSACKEWFVEKSSAFPGENIGILNYAARDVIRALGYECPENIDLQHYLLQMIVSGDTKKCLEYRLINFGTIAPKLKEAIGKNGMSVTL